MSETIFDGIVRTPINRVAARVTTQKTVTDDCELTPEQVHERIIYLTSQRKKIGFEIGIVAHAQHANIMYRANKYPNYVKNHPHSTKLAEWIRIGKEMNRLNKYLADEKQKRREQWAIENPEKAEAEKWNMDKTNPHYVRHSA